MTDFFMLLILAIFGIIGYRLMGLVDVFINAHATDNEKAEQEK